MNDQPELFPPPKPYWQCGRFDGSDVTEADNIRLTGQLERIYDLMKDGAWRTLAEIETATGEPQASISAQLRNLRKRRFGSHAIAKRRRTESLWEYQVAS